MKILKLLLAFFVFGFFFTSCSKDDDNIIKPTPPEEVPETRNLEVENFIYAGLNEIYLYKADVPQLADDFFSTEAAKTEFLEKSKSPEDLFESLLSDQDRFSFIVDDYIALENQFSGKSTTNGMQLALYVYGNNEILAVVNYVLPGTSAEAQGIKRGDVFTDVDGTHMTRSNYSDLLARDSYEIAVAEIIDNVITDTGESVTLTKQEYDTNPVYIVKTFDKNGVKIGYLMYNSFTSNYDSELNAAFAELKAANVEELILDLRYNGGGSVESAVDLSSMITGQFKGEIFMKEQWNKKYQEYFESTNPERIINRFNPEIRTGELINNLNLNRVYVLTTNRTASASELVINGLDPYINVVQVGTTTVGKFQASVTLYDSDDFGREGANKNHTYAIQPLVLKSVNSAGKSDYVNGLAPDIEISEDISAMGVLGAETEPMLEAAINDILGIAQDTQKAAEVQKTTRIFGKISPSKIEGPTFQRMYIDRLPSVPENLKK